MNHLPAPTTNEFRMGGANFLSVLLFRYAWIWLLTLSVAGVCGIVLGIVIDYRWMILGLMVILVILPMIFAFIYYFYALRRECYVNTVNHRLVFEDDGIRAILKFRINAQSDGEKEDQSSGAEGNDAEEIFNTREEFFNYSDMKPYQFGAKSLIIGFRPPRKGFIWVPFDAFESESELARTLDMLTLKLKS